MSMKILTAAVLASVALNASAGCMLRSHATSTVVGKIDEIADIRYVIGPGSHPFTTLCTITGRVRYANQWHNIEAFYQGPSESSKDDLCYFAVELGVKEFIATKSGTVHRGTSQMYCTDEEEIKVKKVEVGDMVKLSEVELHRTFANQYDKHGRECRFFVEDGMRFFRIYRWTGLMCQVNNGIYWQVVDKF